MPGEKGARTDNGYMKIVNLALLMGLAMCSEAAPTANEMLLQIPRRVQALREKVRYGDFSNTYHELDIKWQYARFLEGLIKEVNQDVTSGSALSPEEIKAIGSFARLTVILRDDYVPSTFRGGSGFGMREVDSMIDLYEKVIEDLIPGIGKHLSLFQKEETDWDSAKIDTWLRRFRQVVKRAPAGNRPNSGTKSGEVQPLSKAKLSFSGGKTMSVRLDYDPGESHYRIYISALLPSNGAWKYRDITLDVRDKAGQAIKSTLLQHVQPDDPLGYLGHKEGETHQYFVIYSLDTPAGIAPAKAEVSLPGERQTVIFTE